MSEALGLQWADPDLRRGAVRLDENKTDDPRAWALAPGVAAALAHFQGEPGALVFEPPTDPHGLAELLRTSLLKAGVGRSELHKATAERIALRAHDLRGSFVTIAFANGRSESWVADRTGHRSSQMLARYKRAARTAAELDLGDWTPLDAGLGLASPPSPGGRTPRGLDRRLDSEALPIRFERTTLALGKITLWAVSAQALHIRYTAFNRLRFPSCFRAVTPRGSGIENPGFEFECTQPRTIARWAVSRARV